jgi:hypothetical protein
MITFQIDNAFFMVYKTYGVYVGTVLIGFKKYTLKHSYVLAEEAADELKNVYYKVKGKYAEKLK